MKQHLLELTEKRTTSPGLSMFSAVSYRKFPKHFVDSLAFRNLENFPGDIRTICALSKFSEFLAEWKDPLLTDNETATSSLKFLV